MNDDFLADDYQEPVTSRYMKFEEGDNKFRVLPGKGDKPTRIEGWEYWKTVNGTRKPFRVARDVSIPASEVEISQKTGKLDIRFFWAITVWNYKDQTVQVLEITQKTVRDAIRILRNNKKWGSPTEYDLVVTQLKEGEKTSYTVTPEPKEELSEDIIGQYDNVNVDLMALFKGEDPFTIQSLEDIDMTSNESIEEVETDNLPF
jgi:hypothetical protein